MTRRTSRRPALVVAAAIGAVLIAGCGGDDQADGSAAGDNDTAEITSEGDDTGGDDAGDPFTEECTLARQEFKNLLDPPDDYVELRVTATPGEYDGSTCEWSSNSYAMELMVMVRAYDDYYHDESTGKSVPGLGDESWFNTKVGSLYWRRDDYSISLDANVTETFTERQLVDLAHAIDADLPAE